MVDGSAAQMRALLARSRFFAALDVADLDRVLALARRCRLDSGELLLHLDDEADCVYAILCGRVRVVSPAEDGREVVLRIGVRAPLAPRPPMNCHRGTIR